MGGAVLAARLAARRPRGFRGDRRILAPWPWMVSRATGRGLVRWQEGRDATARCAGARMAPANRGCETWRKYQVERILACVVRHAAPRSQVRGASGWPGQISRRPRTVDLGYGPPVVRNAGSPEGERAPQTLIFDVSVNFARSDQRPAGRHPGGAADRPGRREPGRHGPGGSRCYVPIAWPSWRLQGVAADGTLSNFTAVDATGIYKLGWRRIIEPGRPLWKPPLEYATSRSLAALRSGRNRVLRVLAGCGQRHGSGACHRRCRGTM